MVLFVGSPTNVIICEGFAVNKAGFTAYTILPFLACSLSCYIALAIQFRHVKYIPRILNVSGDLDVKAVLHDPVGACVGGALLGTCLIIIIVGSFFNLQVWMISLPFAVSKFLWDLAWDTYRLKYLKKPALEGKNEKSSMDSDEEDDDVMLRQLKRWKTSATIITEESDLHKLKVEIANAVANGAANVDSSLAADTVPNTVEPIRMLSPANTDAIANGVMNGAANRRVPNTVKPIRMLSPANTVNFNEPLPISSAEASRWCTLINDTPLSQHPSTPNNSKPFSFSSLLSSISDLLHRFSTYLSINFPTFHTALPRLPFALVPFAFCQFILIEGFSSYGWINIFAEWLVIMTKREMFKTVWVVGVLGVLLCNASGTNIGATILLTKIVNTAASTYVPLSSGPEVNINAFLRSAAIALAVASNIGAVSFTFSASLAGLLWRQILSERGVLVRQKTFARWNLGPVVVMTVVGLAVVSAEMAVLY